MKTILIYCHFKRDFKASQEHIKFWFKSTKEHWFKFYKQNQPIIERQIDEECMWRRVCIDPCPWF